MPTAQVTFIPPRLKFVVSQEIPLNELNAYLPQGYKISPKAVLVNGVENENPNGWFQTSYPLLIIGTYSLGISLITHIALPGFQWSGLMNSLMTGFFLVFSAFKMLDLRGFANAYSTYDLLVARRLTYGFIYRIWNFLWACCTWLKPHQLSRKLQQLL